MIPDQVPSLAPEQVADLFLLDVRELDEWAEGHAPTAVHVPLHDLPDRVGELPVGQPLAVVCRVGSRSAYAAAWLLEQGYDARNVDGGMLAWERRGLPVVT
ncbi:MAG: Rhodanese-related sulfurtransferase-like protein [Frankiales bacterium]|nr:Rhodanese-related sulfurtransferase-like protein [Frankiales bacterium]